MHQLVDLEGWVLLRESCFYDFGVNVLESQTVDALHPSRHGETSSRNFCSLLRAGRPALHQAYSSTFDGSKSF